MTSHPLGLTGERTVPGVPEENYWFCRHVAACRLAATRCNNRRVVDAGSGEGYGTDILAHRAAAVVGVEIDPVVVAHARSAYPDRHFVVADACATGLPAATADVVVSLQVIEHLPDVDRFLAEARRILRPGGELIVATPNRLTFTPDADAPVNIFHVEEFTAAELTNRVGRAGFEVRRLLGLHHKPYLRGLERLTGTAFTELVLAPAEGWPRWLDTVVRRVTAADFCWSDNAIDTCLDLFVVFRAEQSRVAGRSMTPGTREGS